MINAIVHVRTIYWYEVEIYDCDADTLVVPMLIYRFSLRREEIRTLPQFFLQLGVEDVIIYCVAPHFYRKEIIAARQVFEREVPPLGLVQQSFW